MSVCTVCTCVLVCACASRTNSERKILKCVWAGAYQRIIQKTLLLLVGSLLCYMAKTSHKSKLFRLSRGIEKGLRLILTFFWLHGQKAYLIPNPTRDGINSYCSIHIRNHLDQHQTPLIRQKHILFIDSFKDI